MSDPAALLRLVEALEAAGAGAALSLPAPPTDPLLRRLWRAVEARCAEGSPVELDALLSDLASEHGSRARGRGLRWAAALAPLPAVRAPLGAAPIIALVDDLLALAAVGAHPPASLALRAAAAGAHVEVEVAGPGLLLGLHPGAEVAARGLGATLRVEGAPRPRCRLLLPAAASAPAPAAQPPAVGGAQAGPLRVLAVDDNEVNRAVVAAALRELGCAVTLARDGEDALQLYSEGRHEVVLMDLHMPRLDGLTAAARLRALERERGWPRCALVALTADRSPGVAEACTLAGMDAHHAKPVEVDRVRALLEALTGRRLSAGPAAAAPPAGVEAPPSLVIDRRQLDMMREVMGAGPFAELVRTFLSHTEEELRGLRAAIEAGDGPRVARCAHSIKSSTAQMGAVALSEVARRIEDGARVGAPGGQRGPLAEAEAALAALRAALEPMG